MSEKPKKPRGFAAMRANNPERLAEISRRGGGAVKPENRSFAKDRDLARRAGGTSKRPKEG